MKKFIRSAFNIALLGSLLTLPLIAQQVKRAQFDVTNYVMDVVLSPSEHKLNANVDVTFKPLEDTRSVAFELNGSLKIDTITRDGRPSAVSAIPSPKTATATTQQVQVTFVQDQTNSSDLGPHVRIDLGETVTKGTPVTLRFKYSGVLELPAGGPLLNKRLAYVGDKPGYLMYAARLFPVHDYA